MSYKYNKNYKKKYYNYHNKKWNPIHKREIMIEKNYQYSNYLKKRYKSKYNDYHYKSNYNNEYYNDNYSYYSYNNDDSNDYYSYNSENNINENELNNEKGPMEKENISKDKNKIDKRIEFHNIKEMALIKVYENHYETIINELKNIRVKKEKEITIDGIGNKCKEKKSVLTEEDLAILKDMENLENNTDTEYYNEYMFFRANKKSIYVPHILKNKNNVLSIFIDDKNLLAKDFQIFVLKITIYFSKFWKKDY